MKDLFQYHRTLERGRRRRRRRPLILARLLSFVLIICLLSSSSLINGLSMENNRMSHKHLRASTKSLPSTTTTATTTTATKNRRAFIQQVAATATTTTTATGITTSSSMANAAIILEDEKMDDTNLLRQQSSSSSQQSSSLSLSTPRLGKEYFNNLPETRPNSGRFYFPTLTPPFLNRATYRYDLGRNMWALEQLLTFANVTATIRTNVIQLQQKQKQGEGDDNNLLWVHSPQWPTGELCTLLDELGTVAHVVLPCNAIEHKAPMAAFLKKYPKASVWISPGQYGPFGTCGVTLFDQKCKMGYRVDGILNDNHNNNNTPIDTTTTTLSSESTSLQQQQQQQPPWMDEFDYTTLYVNLPENAGPVSEVAFFHRSSKTLIVTDAVVYIPDQAPSILETYFDPIRIQNDTTFWPKTVLQSIFLPLRIDERTGRYPGYDAIQNRLIRAPILRGFNDARAPQQVQEWIQRITKTKKWDFNRVISSHFASPIIASPSDVEKVFQYLNMNTNNDDRNKNQNLDTSSLPPIACQDWELLQGLNDFIAENKLGAPATFEYRSGCIDP